MNRRSLMAGMAAIIPATALGQEATPSTSHDPQEILQRYVNDVWNMGDTGAIADLFNEDAFNLLEVERDHRLALDGLRASGSPVELTTITSSDNAAIGYGSVFLDDGQEYDIFIAIWIGGNGKITKYRWMASAQEG